MSERVRVAFEPKAESPTVDRVVIAALALIVIGGLYVAIGAISDLGTQSTTATIDVANFGRQLLRESSMTADAAAVRLYERDPQRLAPIFARLQNSIHVFGRTLGDEHERFAAIEPVMTHLEFVAEAWPARRDALHAIASSVGRPERELIDSAIATLRHDRERFRAELIASGGAYATYANDQHRRGITTIVAAIAAAVLALGAIVFWLAVRIARRKEQRLQSEAVVESLVEQLRNASRKSEAARSAEAGPPFTIGSDRWT